MDLKLGSSGSQVKQLQQKLISSGYDVGASGADGQFGQSTQNALRKYQSDNGLSADGVAGQNTMVSLGLSRPTFTQSTQVANSPTGISTSVPQYDANNDVAYQQAIQALQQVQKETPTYTPSYDGQLQELYDKIVNRDKFQYDVNSDMLYQQYAQQYQNKGRLAMNDTMAQAAALTGGYGSTYGQQVGQQQYDAYMQELTNVIPELYQQAYQHYQDEGDKMMQDYALTRDFADDEYSKYMDTYSQWLAEREFAQNVANTAWDRGFNSWGSAVSQYNADREYELALQEYQLAVDKFEYQKDQDSKAEMQAAAAKLASVSGGGGGGVRYVSKQPTVSDGTMGSMSASMANWRGWDTGLGTTENVIDYLSDKGYNANEIEAYLKKYPIK